jgi:hypothetical protein
LKSASIRGRRQNGIHRRDIPKWKIDAPKDEEGKTTPANRATANRGSAEEEERRKMKDTRPPLTIDEETQCKRLSKTKTMAM